MGNQILHIVTGPLNTVDMEFPGETTVGDIGLTRFAGQLGAVVEFRDNNVPFDASIGTLFGGEYQLVQTVAGSTLAPAVGLVANWTDLVNFVVSPDLPTQPGSASAGIYVSAPTKGNFCMIQVSGVATALCATLTETGVIGDAMFVVTGAKVNNLADATAITAGNLNDYIGDAAELPVTATLNKLFLKGVHRNR